MKKRLANHVHGLPLDWLSLLNEAHPRGVLVGLIIKRAVDMANGEQPVTVSQETYDQVGLTEMMFRRALEGLEHAGLVRVERHRGRLPRITLLKVPRDG